MQNPLAGCIRGENEAEEGPMGCEACSLRSYAERKPKSILAWFWRWHTNWCPGWKAYQRKLQAEKDRVEATR